ncbi:putative disease resistance protein RGA1 [Senna tora]|uniref:Putative disease resistance protein RGA1 n=1 Tax=Senna tora TaxID=362788 RepID=A0A834WFZ4_9FABA|nr:putative disease resistance protein RGA1 [Senna tora]
MAEALLGVVLENLSSFVRDELATFWGVTGEIQRLTNSLELIQAVIVDAEKKEITEESIKIWLQQLKDAAHVLDDILDEYSIRSLPHNSGSSSQAHSFSLSSIKPNNIRFRYRIGKRLKDITQRLDQIAKQRKNYDFVERKVIRERSIQVPEWRQTSSIIAQPQIYGRDGDKDKIVELLLRQTPECGGLSVYPIVGLGGLGKTTLAQLVFNDPRVINHFGTLRIWVCVSDDFSVIRILQSIMVAITKQECNIKDLDPLQNIDVGNEIWNELYHKSLFQEVTTDDDGCIRFKMHDLVHDLAQSVTGKECSVIKGGDITNLPRNTHHISLRKLEILKFIYCFELRSLPEGLNNLQNLRHLIILWCPYLSRMPPGIGKLSRLRTLNLFIVRSEEGHSLKELHHLNLCQRELSIKGLECVGSVDEAKGVNLIGIKELRVLSLSWDNSEESEIKAVGVDAEQVIEALQPFSNLKNLKLQDCSNCVQLPALGKLPSLETLSIVNMACVEYLDDDECYDGVEVKAFISLKTLELYGMPKLERLLKREGGEMFPHLHILYISSCPKLTLSCLPSVEELNLGYSKEELVKSISNLHGLKWLNITGGSNLPTQLPALEILVLNGCDELECIPEQVLEALNSLRTLRISKCRALKCLPEAIQHLTSLECLIIRDCPILEERCKEGSGEDWHKIQHIPKINIE